MPSLILAVLLSVAPLDAGVSDSLIIARTLAIELSSGKFDEAVARFAPEVAAKLPASALAQQWKQLVGPLGAFKRLGEVREDGSTIFVECQYDKASLHLKIGLDAQRRVVTLRPTSGRPPEVFEAAGRATLDELATGAWAKAVAKFSPEVAKALPAEGLANAWASIVSSSGAYQRVLEVNVDAANAPFTVVDLTCAFAKTNLVVSFTFDGALQISGLFFKPAWSPPPYADASLFEERTLTVGAAAWPLPATLTLPKGKGPFPVVVLVHGSGPNDADESIGPNKLFKDLAWGLASRKIAVLRYEKRTRVYRAKLSNADIVTVKEEVTEDALAAVALLAGMKEIDHKHIFVAGHSLGAGLAPRIAAAEPRVHGLVLLAGSTRKLWDLVVEQRKYLAALAPSETLTAAVAQAESSAKKLNDPLLKPDEIVDGLTATYWLDLRNEDPAQVAAKLKVPMLVLQGERDYQVTMTDFAGWKKALGKRKTATLKSYAALNHHFLPGTGKSTPTEYAQPGHVPVEVIDDLAKWLRAH